MSDNLPQAKDEGPKFFDVMRPGKTPPPPTSRPIIASSPAQPDPMVKPVEPPQPPVPTAEAPTSDQPVPQTPQNAEDYTDQQPTAVNVEADAKADDQPVPQVDQAAVDQPPAQSEPEVQPPTEQSSVNNQAEGQTQPTPETAANNQVVVVHHAKSNKAFKLTILIFSIVIIVIIVFDLLMDAGILKLGLPHTNFLGK